MRTRRTGILLTVIVFHVGVRALPARQAADPDKTWQQKARESGLSDADISTLEQDRILVTNEAFKQVFTPYLSRSEIPSFITSDSLLNAYHVLYEESILRLENKMASQLPDVLKLTLTNLGRDEDHFRASPALVAAARKRAMLVTGIALRLMDDSFRFEDDKLNVILDQEAHRIQQATDVIMPEWLGKSRSSLLEIDYSRYKPRGFYTKSERLERYFRAVSWLQSIPFCISRDDELLAILMLGKTLRSESIDDREKSEAVDTFFRSYSPFIGEGDDWDLITATRELESGRLNSGDRLQARRQRLTEKARRFKNAPLINDQHRYSPDDPNRAAEPNFRILSAYRTPSAILFHRTTNTPPFFPRRLYPDGLEVAAALGSAFARNSLQDPQKQNLLDTIDSCKICFQGRGLYFQYLNAIEALLDESEHDAPDFMRGTPWERKSCNTVLAGWAQLRHTWALQAKQTVQYAGLANSPEGFVEPEPEFFSRMATLADSTRALLEQSGAFGSPYMHIIQSFEKFKRLAEGAKDKWELMGKVYKLPHEEMMDVSLPVEMLWRFSPSQADTYSEAYFTETVEWIEKVAEDIRKGRIDDHPELERLFRDASVDIEGSWESLAQTCRRLETIAHKRLRGVDLNSSEIRAVRRYGLTIAQIMLYGGNSYLSPRDDAPRIVDVYSNPNTNPIGYLHVGIARPRKIYVLYPWKGETILCTGAVMPYYEFVEPTRLTDDSWKQKLDSDHRPAITKWLSPLVADGTLGAPDLDDNH